MAMPPPLGLKLNPVVRQRNGSMETRKQNALLDNSYIVQIFEGLMNIELSK